MRDAEKREELFELARHELLAVVCDDANWQSPVKEEVFEKGNYRGGGDVHSAHFRQFVMRIVGENEVSPLSRLTVQLFFDIEGKSVPGLRRKSNRLQRQSRWTSRLVAKKARLTVLDVSIDVGVNAWQPGAVSKTLAHLDDA